MRAADKDNLAAFNNNFFVTWGDACLQITQPGTCVVTVDVRNDHILLAPRSGKIKTAVGKITSNPLEIIVVN